jgi:hypothetical protein
MKDGVFDMYKEIGVTDSPDFKGQSVLQGFQISDVEGRFGASRGLASASLNLNWYFLARSGYVRG